MADYAEALRKALVEVLVPEIRLLREDLQTHREELSQRLEALERRTNDRFDALTKEMHERFEAQSREMNGRFEAQNHRFDTLTKEMHERFLSLEKEFAASKAQSEAHQRLTEKILNRLDYAERIIRVEEKVELIMEKISL